MKTKTKKKIAFVLNTTGLTGGVRVIYEYANRFAQDGHQVYIVHLLKINPNLKGTITAIEKKAKYLALKSIKKDQIKWFDLNKNIIVLRLVSLSSLPKIDIIIATANETADWVNDFQRENVQKFYFIQDYENWSRDLRLVDRTYRFPLKRIVISSWLKNMLKEKFKVDAAGPVINGIDIENFNNPHKKFNQDKRIIMLYHYLPKKGIKYGFEAFHLIQAKYPKVKLILFGLMRPKERLPQNTEFTLNPTRDHLRQLYQTSDIFISSSLQEGCQAPPMEAMCAQCAVVATNVGGVPDYATNHLNALVVPPKNAKALADAVIELLENEKLMKKIAKAGYLHSHDFSWSKAYQKMKKIIIGENET